MIVSLAQAGLRAPRAMGHVATSIAPASPLDVPAENVPLLTQYSLFTRYSISTARASVLETQSGLTTNSM